MLRQRFSLLLRGQAALLELQTGCQQVAGAAQAAFISSAALAAVPSASLKAIRSQAADLQSSSQLLRPFSRSYSSTSSAAHSEASSPSNSSSSSPTTSSEGPASSSSPKQQLEQPLQSPLQPQQQAYAAAPAPSEPAQAQPPSEPAQAQPLAAAYGPRKVTPRSSMATAGTLKREGIVHVNSTFNNTIMVLTDRDSKVQTWTSGGTVGYKNANKATPMAAELAAKELAKRAVNLGFHSVVVKLKGMGKNKQFAVQSLAASGLTVTQLWDVTPIPYNGCRLPRRRRV